MMRTTRRSSVPVSLVLLLAVTTLAPASTGKNGDVSVDENNDYLTVET